MKTRLLIVGVLAAVACKSPVDPDRGRFSCKTAADCGSGYQCIAQAAGGSLCFKEGACTTEECNGRDDNCDGLVDESFTGMNGACETGRAGPCAPGTRVCRDAGVACVGSYTPVAESCNAIDDDCQNGVDDGFNFSTDNAHCGGCGRACPTGTQCQSARCRETNCSDGLDNDDAGQADCLDSNCLSRGCGFDGGFNCGASVVDAGAPDAGATDGGVDDGGSADAGPGGDGGVDGGASDAGTVELACVPREAICFDGRDDDLDGKADCTDSDCDGRACDGGACTAGTCR